ncbi:MAG: DUF4458 domain-containing protein [Rikenellaceae bacterium]
MINKLNMFKSLLLMLLGAVLFVGCTESPEESVSSGYGYVQFKLYKESDTRAVDELEYLNDAKKVRVTLSMGNSTITQTLLLSAYDTANAEYGLRSDKLELLIGSYQVASFILYDSLDEVLYSSYGSGEQIDVVDGGLSVTSLYLDAQHYGNVNFTFTKNFYNETRSDDVDLYLFSSVGYVSLTLKDKYNQTFDMSDIEVSYSINYERDEDGNVYQAAVLTTDEYINIPSGDWSVDSYSLKSSLKAWLANSPATDIIDCSFTVSEDYKQSIDVPLVLSEEEDHIQDYRALKAIWEALDGENWYYQGVNYQTGVTWDFNKDIDMWGDQPGVFINSNGRVTSLNLSDFGVRGHMPEELGQLTELTELYIGTHSDENVGGFYYDKSDVIAAAISPELRMAYVEAGVEIPGGIEATGGYYTPSQRDENPMMRSDVQSGVITSDLRSLPSSIGGLSKLQTIYIANTTITELPVEIAQLSDLTFLELYNLPYMTTVPELFELLPKSLMTINISENLQWGAPQILEVIEKMSVSPAAESLQLFYCYNNNLEILPSCLENMSSLGLMHFASNNIEVVESMPTLRPIQLYLGDNKISYIPDDFCDTDDLESMSVDYNQLENFPNLFSSSQIPIESLSFSNNKIKELPEGFKGVNVTTLNLQNNLFEEYPAGFAESNSVISTINLSYNNIKGFAENCFVYEYSYTISSIDLQFNQIEELPNDFYGNNLPFLYGVDLSYNRFDHFPYNVLYSPMLTVFIFRAQRDADGNRIMKEWPLGVYNHTGLRALYLGSNDLRTVDDTISYMIYMLDISDNPNISIDLSGVCDYIEAGYYMLYYDKTQDIRNCPYLGITN